MPAYNEEVTIEATIRSLLSLDYRIYEIIVVSDGSKDRTGEIVAERFGLHPVKRPIRRQVPCKNALSVYEGTGGNHVPIILINKENMFKLTEGRDMTVTPEMAAAVISVIEKVHAQNPLSLKY